MADQHEDPDDKYKAIEEKFDFLTKDFRGVKSKQDTLLETNAEPMCQKILGDWSQDRVKMANECTIDKDTLPSDWAKNLRKGLSGKYSHRGSEQAQEFLEKVFREL
mmetsp:Transcript_8364/g.21546  ORF Transcript_8364/g.21546 Transcript_8364/m.21546 type:complete len:106 (-) Transcript_8364:1429-1746(-)